MKSSFPSLHRLTKTSLAVVAMALGFTAGGCASGTNGNGGTQPQGQPPELQVQVQLPANSHPMRSQDIEDAFGDRIATALHEQGFHGRIAILWDTDQPTPGVPLLTVNLLEWRVDPTGNVDCTFGANLQTPLGEKSLGLFTGTSMMTWAERDWFLRAQDFREAAGTAMNDLWSRIQSSGIMPAPSTAPATR